MIKLITVIFLGFYFITTYLLFLKFQDPIDFPVFKHRLGTILWHSSDQGGVTHIYCYYPKSQAKIERVGEKLLVRVESYQDCQNFLGVVEFQEAEWVSEREKMLWSQSELDVQILAEKNQEINGF